MIDTKDVVIFTECRNGAFFFQTTDGEVYICFDNEMRPV